MLLSLGCILIFGVKANAQNASGGATNAPDPENSIRKVEKSFSTKLSTADGKTSYVEGDVISFKVQSDHDCYIAVIDYQNDGTSVLIFPNAFNQSNFLTAGKVTEVPGTVKHGFEIQISPPFGKDVVQVIACTSKAGLEKITSSYPTASSDNPYPTRTRGMIDGGMTRGIKISKAKDSTPTSDNQKVEWSEDHLAMSTGPK